MGVKRIAILGSTGSIGINTLKVIERFPQKFKVVALTAYNNFKLLEKQIESFSPKIVASGPEGIKYLKGRLGRGITVVDANSGPCEIAARDDVDVVVIAMRGSVALQPFLTAVRRGKTVAPANKEALVIAGLLLMAEAKKHHSTIVPIDSEQSAIFQCLNGQRREELKKVYLTASGGPLLDIPQKSFARLTVREILKHPRWKMGKKITVDSATLMNKGFEVIEAQNLFQLNFDQIEVIIHREAIIHSMVEFKDGSILAQLGVTDMRLPIQYALTFPERLDTGLPSMDFCQLGQLSFQKPDLKKFPALALCLWAAKQGKTVPAVLNAADEVAVEAFLTGRLPFHKIYSTIENIVVKHKPVDRPDIEDILEADQWARDEARAVLT